MFQNKKLKQENEDLKNEIMEKDLEIIEKKYISKDKIREKIKMLENELRKNNENIEYTRKLIYTVDETIKKEIKDLGKLLEE